MTKRKMKSSPYLRRNVCKVLGYHRVLPAGEIEEQITQRCLSITSDSFRKQVLRLKSKYEMLSMDEFINAVAQEDYLSNPSCVITFDDGWRDNYLYAFPILKELSVPATIFVATEHIDSGKDFWPEELTGLLLAWDFDRPEALEYLENVLGSSPQSSDLASRQAILEFANRVIIDLKDKPLGMIREKLSRLKETIQEFRNWEAGERSICEWEELREMAESGLITIGSHGNSHAILTSEDSAFCGEELALSKEKIQGKLGATARHFSYPNGSFNNAIEKLVIEAGYESACTCATGVNRAGADPFRISRIPINESRSLDSRGRFSEKKFAFSISNIFQMARKLRDGLNPAPY